MTKSQIREVQTIKLFHAMGERGAVARALSALIRSALRQRDADELRQLAAELRVVNHPEFLV